MSSAELDLVEKIREELFSQPDVQHTELQLVASLGVSRTPIREALVRLEHDGIIERHRNGIVLHAPTPKEVADLFDLRALLEGHAAAEVVRTGALTKQLLEILLEHAQGYEESIKSEQFEEMKKHSMGFHTEIVNACGNVLLQQIWQTFSIHTRVIQVSNATYQAGQAVRDENPWPHGALLECLKTGTPGEAETAFREHLLYARKSILQRMTGISF